MIVPKPHFLLFCDGSHGSSAKEPAVVGQRGRWRFVLEDLTEGTRLEATDAESASAPDRLSLMAVVRGLEALSQPSRVTLVTSSRYVSRGLQYGLSEWRENSYCWEHFGSVQPIRNADLWQRIDQALQFHSLNCRLMLGDDQKLGGENQQGYQVTLTSEPIQDAHGSPEIQADFGYGQLHPATPAVSQATENAAETLRYSALLESFPSKPNESFRVRINRIWMQLIKSLKKFLASYRIHTVPA